MTNTVKARWFPGLDIPLVFREVILAVGDASYVLITTIDSSPNVASLPSVLPPLRSSGAFHAVVNGDVVVDLDTAQELMYERGLFAGFDELWLCAQVPGSSKPEGLRTTSDKPLRGELPVEAADWMSKSGCRVGLGDGDGLNLVTSDDRVSAAIMRLGDREK